MPGFKDIPVELLKTIADYLGPQDTLNLSMSRVTRNPDELARYALHIFTQVVYDSEREGAQEAVQMMRNALSSPSSISVANRRRLADLGLQMINSYFLSEAPFARSSGNNALVRALSRQLVGPSEYDELVTETSEMRAVHRSLVRTTRPLYLNIKDDITWVHLLILLVAYNVYLYFFRQ